MKKLNVLILLASLATTAAAPAQVMYESVIGGYNTVNTYTPTGANTDSSATLISSGLNEPNGLLLDGSGDLFVANMGGNTIGEYNASNGQVVNSDLINVPNSYDSGGPVDMAFDPSGNLLVANENASGTNPNVVDYYISGPNAGTVDTNFTAITGLHDTMGLAVSGSDLFVANAGFGGSIGVYNAGTGAAINASLVTTNLHDPYAVAISGSNMYVMNAVGSSENIIQYTLQYSGNTPSIVTADTNTSFITGLNEPEAMTISGNDLYVSTAGDIYEYQLNGSSAPTLLDTYAASSNAAPSGLAVAAVPEPSSWALALVAIGTAVYLRRRALRA